MHDITWLFKYRSAYWFPGGSLKYQFTGATSNTYTRKFNEHLLNISVYAQENDLLVDWKTNLTNTGKENSFTDN